MAKHPTLDVQQASRMFSMLWTIATTDVIHTRLATLSLIVIVNRFYKRMISDLDRSIEAALVAALTPIEEGMQDIPFELDFKVRIMAELFAALINLRLVRSFCHHYHVLTLIFLAGRVKSIKSYRGGFYASHKIDILLSRNCKHIWKQVCITDLFLGLVPTLLKKSRKRILNFKLWPLMFSCLLLLSTIVFSIRSTQSLR
jgi:hypothetical protein